ncbi:MAG TPA: alpha/beta hydrolase [Kofleriaceae bacterium]
MLVLGLAAGCQDVVSKTDIAYDDRYTSTRMDAYAPGTIDTDELRPAVIVIHGGSWSTGFLGERDTMEDHARRLAAAGYVAFNLSYRLLGGDGIEDGGFPGTIQDPICALAYVRAHADEYGVDPDRISSYGYSAGGHLASMLGVATDGPLVAPDCAAAMEAPNNGVVAPVVSVVSGAGVEDFHLLPDIGTVRDFLHGSCDEQPANCDASSPIKYVAPGAPPFLFIQGDEDLIVDYDNTLHMREALIAVGTEARVLEIPGGGHLSNQTAAGDTWDLALAIDTPAAWEATIDFFDHTIGDAR